MSFLSDRCPSRMKITEGNYKSKCDVERGLYMEHLDLFFMIVGVVYACYVVVGAIIKLDTSVKKRRRRA